jgi:hypothetical protein
MMSKLNQIKKASKLKNTIMTQYIFYEMVCANEKADIYS